MVDQDNLLRTALLDMNPRGVKDCQDIIKETTTIMEEFRKGCSHEKGYKISMWSERIGSMYPARICNVCLMNIPGITQEEIKKCNDDLQKEAENNSKQMSKYFSEKKDVEMT